MPTTKLAYLAPPRCKNDMKSQPNNKKQPPRCPPAPTPSTFYNTHAASFSATRQAPWQGWYQLLPLLQKRTHLRVLDIGAGNGRFYDFLIKNSPPNLHELEYVALEPSQELINIAKARIRSQQKENTLKNTTVHFIKTSFPINNLLISSAFDEQYKILTIGFNLIVAFGVFHHIETSSQRVEFLTQMKTLLTDDGIGVVTLWEIKKHPTFTKRVVRNLGNNNYILNWQNDDTAQRFYHYITQTEEERLVEQSKINIINSFYADGKSKNLNKYLIFS